MSVTIDVAFDFRIDTPAGKDPDALSPTLRKYHRILWGRPLPNGKPFELDATLPIKERYLYHKSALGEFNLSSDSIIPTFTRWKRMQPIISQFAEVDNEAFRAIGYTIGGMMIWPSRSTSGAKSINVARGLSAKINDRMDLTLECIRRYYLGMSSPMDTVMAANGRYFDIFGNFKNFVRHFLLDDLTTDNYSRIIFFTPFDNFEHFLLPSDVVSYNEYKRRSIDFIEARNQRILTLARGLTE